MTSFHDFRLHRSIRPVIHRLAGEADDQIRQTQIRETVNSQLDGIATDGGFFQYFMERYLDILANWYRDRRPFYRLWPGFLEQILQFDWDLEDALNVREELRPILLEFPKASELLLDSPSGPLRVTLLLFEVIPNGEAQGIYCWAFDDQTSLKDGEHLKPFCFRIPIEDGRGQVGESLLNPTLIQLFKIVAGVLFLRKSPDVMRPIVLNRDRRKFAETGDPRFVDRAIRNGVFGFDLGADIPTAEEFRSKHCDCPSPHLRRSHFQRYWTGRGRTCPVLLYVRQTVVNWNVMKQVPTGYYDDRQVKKKALESS